MVNVGELKKRLSSVDNGLEVVIEADKGRRFSVLTAKRRGIRAGHGSGDYFWIATGTEFNAPSMQIKARIRNIDAEADIIAMAEPDKNGQLCVRVVECE